MRLAFNKLFSAKGFFMQKRYTSVDRFGLSLLLALGLSSSACTTEESGGNDVSVTPDSGTNTPDSSADVVPDTIQPGSCGTSTPLLVGGQTTGYETCENGALHRTAIQSCENLLPRTTTCEAGTQVHCTTDSDCTDSPYGHCNLQPFDSGCACRYGCTEDSECEAGSICLCGDPVGQCVAASCKSDADCGDGFGCVAYVTMPGCGGTAFTCQTAQDTCASSANCAFNESCGLLDGRLQCVPNNCVIGRPFLVEGDERTASAVARGDWNERGLCPSLVGLTQEQRGVLAEHWTRIGLMEHASVAAFARFTMQLMALGAPPDLLTETQSAMADETRHARQAFALASAYAGELVGPGALSIDGALGCVDLREVLHLTIHEGCIGETVAAVEAAEAAGRAQDPVVKGVLAKITEEEGRHAALAWRTVQWALERAQASGDTTLRAFVEAEFEAATAAARAARPLPVSAADEAWVALGVVGESLRAELRRQALQRVIWPCAQKVLLGLGSGSGLGGGVGGRLGSALGQRDALEQLPGEVA